MKRCTWMFWTALLCGATTAGATEVAATGTAGAAKAASAPAVKATAKPGGAAPVAGGSGGGIASDGSNLGTQVGPKKPKCPDPVNTACPAVKAPAGK